MKDLLTAVFVAAAYFYYNWQFFQYEREMLNIQQKKVGQIQVAFLGNYVFFMVMSLLNIHLCINWTLFLLILFMETVFIFKCPTGRAYVLALTGTAMGLAANVFFRCIFSIALNKPLIVFDNNVIMSGNLKRYPVFLGFLAVGMFFQLVRAKGIPAKIRTILEDPESLGFLRGLQSVLYVYLVLNLLGYYTRGNSFPMKVWGIKSALFSTLGLFILIIYIVYMNQLKLYKKEVKARREELLATKKDEEKVWIVAFTDTLTGCYNRQYAKEMFAELEESETDAVLCFIDLDGLKTVNDSFGHLQGDRYLTEVVRCIRQTVRDGQDYIFRYGGDEFLLLVIGVSPETVELRMRKIQEQLQELSNTPEFPFALSISHGIAARSEAKNMKETVALADERMYVQKQKKKEKKGTVRF